LPSSFAALSSFFLLYSLPFYPTFTSFGRLAILVSFGSLLSNSLGFVASNLMLLVLFVIVYVILLDELVMSSAQRRFGPFNIGVFGLLASIVNGLNLLFVQSFFIMSSYSFVMFSGPIVFLLVLLLLFSLIMPLYLLDVYFSFFVFVLASSVLVFVYFLLSYSSFSKYSIIGSFRIVVQFLAFGLVFDIILAIFSYIYSHSIFSLSSLFSLSLFQSAVTIFPVLIIVL
jgi:NADH:ubiquinone oxidoreductase subunit H